MKKMVIVGNGGFAKEVYWIIERINAITPTWEFLGFIDKDTNHENVIGDDEFVCSYDAELNVAIAIGTSRIRRELHERYSKNKNILFPNLIDPAAILSDRILLGDGNIICAGVIITVDIAIGNCNIINLSCTVGHDAVIKDYVTINPSSNISGKTLIESGVEIGTGTQIIPGVRIGNNSIIGAGAVVNRELPSDCTAVGVPAKVIKIREDITK